MSFAHIAHNYKHTWYYLPVLVMISVLVLPLLLGRASAAQITERSIAISTSKVSTSATYDVSFIPATTGEVEGIVVDICMNSPLPGIACTKTNGVTNSPDNPATIDVTHDDEVDIVYTVHTNSATDGTLIMSTSTGITSDATNPVTFSFTVTNPSTTGSFYARIFTFSTAAAAASYDDETPGSYVDYGGIAMSTVNQLTITARVQEVLQFCVGSTDADSANDCTDISGTTIDIGVVDSTATAATANDAGKAMVRTNASSGVVIDYFAEQAGSGTNHLGALRVSGATCSGDGTVASGSKTDQCFNSIGTTQSVIGSSDEAFGMTAEAVNTANGSTTNLARDTQYDGSGSGGYAWDASGSFDRIASSTTVVDDEMLELKFAARAAATTPTGAYSVVATFVATGTF